MNFTDTQRQVWMENCWDHQAPLDPATNQPVSKNQMITVACKSDGAILEDLIATQCVHGNGDQDRTDQEFKDSVFLWWQLYLQDYDAFFAEAA